MYVLAIAPLVGFVGRFRPARAGTDAQTVITSVAPLAPPVLLGIALDIRELVAIF